MVIADLSRIANRTLDECESTNDLARSLGDAGYPQGTWVSARRQTRGRGRQGRVWRSIEGNLFLSMVARVEDPALWTWLPLMAAVCVANAADLGSRDSRVSIKWPNDLFLSGAKIGGILCEGVSSAGSQHIVIGVGVNCEAAPEELDQPASALTWIDVDAFRATVVDELRRGLDRLVSERAQWIHDAYSSRALLSPGAGVEWADRNGKVIGLGPSAELRVVDSATLEEVSLYAEDVRIRRAQRS